MIQVPLIIGATLVTCGPSYLKIGASCFPAPHKVTSHPFSGGSLLSCFPSTKASSHSLHLFVLHLCVRPNVHSFCVNSPHFCIIYKSQHSLP